MGMPRAYSPMLATLTEGPFDDAAWVFETKWDGFRMIAEVKEKKARLFSRNGTDITKRYPSVAEALSRLRERAVVDGELVALDARGVSRFQLLQNALRKKARLRYMVFDVLFIGGRDMRKFPFTRRRMLLAKLLPKSAVLLLSRARPRFGTKYFAEAKRRGWEGIMAKRAASPYYSGERSRDWLKIKSRQEQEVVIAGFTAPRRSRKYFGSLVLAVRDGKRWRYVGHAGTGFSHETLKTLYALLSKIKTNKNPFGRKVKFESETTWVKPKLVAEVQFAEWTKGGEMRQPAYLGLRTDKKAESVRAEKPVLLR